MLTAASSTDWLAFVAVVVGAMLLDRLLLGRPADWVSFREAALRSALWVTLGLCYTLYVWWSMGRNHAVDYLVAFVVEKSLSVDNLFVFLVIFTYFGVKESLQRRVLLWGVAGAVIMRGIFILAGTALLAQVHWMMYVFGGFLIITGLRLGFRKDDQVDPERNLALRLARRYLRTTDSFDGDRFFTTKDGVRYATPLLLVLLVVEFTDLVFAVDSVPAVLAISQDVYIVYASNVFAILGLRALYFLLAGMMSRFHYLNTGLAVVLVFVGAKMLVEGVWDVPNWASLAFIFVVLGTSVAASLARREPSVAPPVPPSEEA
jgi:tellurite resistance protein TerC